MQQVIHLGSVDYCGLFSSECLYTLGKTTMEIQ